LTALLRLESVVLHRGGRLLFDGIDLTLEAGEALHLRGPNGSGKSSLIRLAAGLLRPQSGRVARSKVALADDSTALDSEWPLRRALRFWSGLAGADARIDEAIAALGLTDLSHVPVRLLSSGQAKRAALARVLGSDARLWLLDEPLNGLDAQSVTRLDKAIVRHRQAGGAVLAASHGPLAGRWTSLDLGA
jgi:heme exporter protein A